MKITKKIKSFEDACQALGIEPVLPEISHVPDEKIQKSAIAFIKLSTITKALNEGWKPDWTDMNQYKYFPWFYVDSAGLAYANTDTAVTSTVTDIGSRLGFKTEDLCDYAKEQFKDLYIDLLF